MSKKGATERIEDIKGLQWLCRSAIDQWRRGEVEAFSSTCQQIASTVEQDGRLAEIIEWTNPKDLEQWLRVAAAIQIPVGRWVRLESGAWAVKIEKPPDDVREGDFLFVYAFSDDGYRTREYMNVAWLSHEGAIGFTVCWACRHLRYLCQQFGCDCAVCEQTKEYPWSPVVIRRKNEKEEL